MLIGLRRFGVCLLCLVAMGGCLVSVSHAEALSGAASPITSLLGAGGEQALEGEEGQQAAAEASLASPEAVAARLASQTSYRNENESQAARTLREAFPAVVSLPDGGPPQLVSGERSLGFESAMVEQVQTASGDPGVVQSTVPIAIQASAGHWTPVDLALREAGGQFEAQDPLVPVVIPKRLDEGAQIPSIGVSVTPVDAQGAPLGGSEGLAEGTGVVFANTQSDADTVVKPSSLGVDVSTVLRSPESPEVLYYRVGMPHGAHLAASPSGAGFDVMDEGAVVASIHPPNATDAAGTPVPASMAASGDTLAVSVRHDAGSYEYPILVDPEFQKVEGNVTPANWEFHEWIGYTYGAGGGGGELWMNHAAGSFADNDYASWSERTKGYTKIYKLYARDELYPWSAPAGQRDTPPWLEAYIEIYKYPGGQEALSFLSGSPYKAEETVCVGGCNPEGASSGNVGNFELDTTEAGSTPEQFYAHGLELSTGIAQESGEHSKVAYNTSSSEIESQPNVLAGSGSWLGPNAGRLEFSAEDGGLGVSETRLEVYRSGKWEQVHSHNFLGTSSCAGIQCAADESERVSWSSLTEGGAKPLPEPEARIRVAADSYMPYSTSAEHGEGEVTLKVDQKPPHGFALSGLPMKGTELTLGEGASTLVAEASDGEGTTESSGIKEIQLYIDGSEVGHEHGACSPGPCTAGGQWSLKGAEYGAGAHTLTVLAVSNSGERGTASYTLNVYAASPMAAGPGSVNPESGDFALEASDVDLSGGLGSLMVSRHYDSRNLKEGEAGPFGPQWSISLANLASLEVLPDESVMVIGPEGLMHFEKHSGVFEAPKGDANLELSYVPNYESSGKPAYLFKDTEQDTTTVFMLPEHARSWMPVVSKGPSATNTTADEYQAVEVASKQFIVEPTLELAPHPNAECAKGNWHAGCRALEFVYYESTTATGTESEGEWGGYKNRLHEIVAVAYNPATKKVVKTPVAAYLFDSRGWLRAEWNPSISPALKTTDAYDSEGHVVAVTPPGQQPWLMHYGTTATDTSPGRLLSVGRLGAKASGAKTPLKSTAAPTLSTSSPVIGTTLSVTNGSWSSSPAALYSYQWEDCSSSTSECVLIPGAVNATYTPQPRDAGYMLLAEVTAENGSGAAMVQSAESNPVAMSTPTYSSVFGSSGTESEKLKSPAGVAVDGEGDVWVADTGGNRIEKFSSTGAFVASYAPDSMLEPMGIAVSPTNSDVYVTNRGHDRIDQLSSSGALIRSFGSEGTALGKLSAPDQVTIDAHGDVWVADSGNARVDEFSASGTYLRSVYGGGPFGGRLKQPVGVAVCGEVVYVVDQASDTVQELDLAGLSFAHFGVTGKEGSGNGEFAQPSQIACEPAGNDVYVADKANGRIQEFNGGGAFLDKFGATGSGEGQLSTPVGIAVGQSGNVYVGDSGNNRVSKWKASYSTNNPAPTPPSLAENPVSTIEYNIPVSGTGLPALTSTEVAKWAQTDDPMEGTAIFPPDEPMGWPAANYERATISYVDQEMRAVNVASPTGGISTTEYNATNEVTRTLSAQNRAAALKEANPAAASEQLDTKSAYNEQDELTSTWGPVHTVKLATGKSEPNETVLARNHVKYFYDEGAPGGESFQLVTKTEDGAETASKEEFDVRTARTGYAGQNGLGWKLRKATSTTTDPAGLDLTHSVEYNEATGAVVETKAPGATSELVYPPVFAASFGSAGSGNGQLSEPTGAAVDASGDVWVVDRGNDRVEKFSPAGAFIAAYGSKGSGDEELLEPWGIAVNQSTGNVYVADGGNNRVEELNSAGKFVAAFGWGVQTGAGELQRCTSACKAGLGGSGTGEFAEVFGVAVDSSGDVWVTDEENDRVEEFSAEGAYINEFGSAGAGNGQLNGPLALALSEGEVYVSDYGNDRIEEFSQAGAYLGQIGSKGSKEGQLEGPYGIAANPTSGDLFVADGGNNRMQEFSPAGKFLAEFGSYGTGKGQLHAPTGVAINATGDLYVADADNDRVEEWQPPQAGGAHLLYSTQFGSTGSGNGQFNYAAIPAIDGHGNVWATDYGNNRVQELTAGGVFIACYGSYGSGEKQFEGPTGIAVNQASGNVYIADSGNDRIEELSSTGTFIRAFGSYGSEPGKLHSPGGVKIDSSGNVWVADGGNNRIEEYSSTGTFIAAYGTAGSGHGQFENPADLTFSEGHIFVADAGNSRIEELTTTGTYVGQFGSEGSGSGYLQYPEGITSDAAGNLYIVDRGNNRIEEYTPAGKFLATFGSYGTGEGQLNGPQGLALDAAGNLYVTDGYNNRIQKWTNSNQAVHDTKTIYYTASTEAPVTTCQNHPEWVGLPCQTEPGAQPGEGMPSLPVKNIQYNMWNQPEITTETFGSGESKVERKTKTTFDAVGRPLTTEETSSNDQPLPKIADGYNTTNGALETQSIIVGEKAKTITSVESALGEVESYTDSDGNTAKYTRDIDGRVVKITDGSEEASKKYGYEGWQEYSYSKTTGEITKLTDSAAGVFTPSWTVGGQLAKETYPNGMSANYTINSVGEDTGLEYKKETHCTEKCVWFSDEVVPSIHGEGITQASSLSKETNSFNAAGWLTQVQETPTGEGCKTRIYKQEEEGNRTSLTTREPATEGKCATEGGPVARHTYSAANQLTDPGVTYEAFGNTTTLPASDAGEATLTSSYYVDNQLYKQTQSGTEITYETDPEDRTRETITTAGAETSKVISHYDAPGSALAWTVEPTTGKWTRDIPGINCELTATQTNTTAPVLLLHDLQGNIVAEAAISETETKLLKTYNSTEYGVPTKKEAPPKYAWLGASGLASELPSGTITQDGITYVPQTGRPLQTQPVEPQLPINSYNSYVRPETGAIQWAAISGALAAAQYWESQQAQGGAATPPGSIPAAGSAPLAVSEALTGGCTGVNACAAASVTCNKQSLFGEGETGVLWLVAAVNCSGKVSAIQVEAQIWALNRATGKYEELINDGKNGHTTYGHSRLAVLLTHICAEHEVYKAWVWGDAWGTDFWFGGAGDSSGAWTCEGDYAEFAIDFGELLAG